MARPPTEVSVMVRTAADLLHKISLDRPPTRIVVDKATLGMAGTDGAVRSKLKALLQQGVQVAPAGTGRAPHQYMPPVKQADSQMSRPLSGYRLRDVKTDVLSERVYNNPRPRPLRGVVATVFGPRGLLGTQLVAQLAQYGATVICPVRAHQEQHPLKLHTRDFRHLTGLGDQGQVIVVVYDPTNFEETTRLVDRSQVVFNCIGAPHYPLVNQSQNFGPEAVFTNMPRLIARACAMRGVQRLVHTSHLNADPASAVPFFKYKGLGEAAVMEEFPNAIIVRPGDLFGARDNFTVTMGSLVTGNSWPILGTHTYLLKGNPYVECQPVWVVDVARGMVRAAMREYAFGQTYQFAGPHRYKLIEVMRYVEALSKIQPSHIRLYSPLEVKLRFDRPGGEFHKSWVDWHLRESVVPRDGVKSWADIELDPSALTKMENICGDWLGKPIYRNMQPTGWEHAMGWLTHPEKHGEYMPKYLIWPVVGVTLFFSGLLWT